MQKLLLFVLILIYKKISIFFFSFCSFEFNLHAFQFFFLFCIYNSPMHNNNNNNSRHSCTITHTKNSTLLRILFSVVSWFKRRLHRNCWKKMRRRNKTKTPRTVKIKIQRTNNLLKRHSCFRKIGPFTRKIWRKKKYDSSEYSNLIHIRFLSYYCSHIRTRTTALWDWKYFFICFTYRSKNCLFTIIRLLSFNQLATLCAFVLLTK